MAAAISGRARPPLYTTGPNTRNALSQAGALGATTGSVIHLHAAPTPGPSVSAVLAHELTHTRSPVRRPRFFLGGGLSSLLDDDERGALAAGAQSLVGKGREAASGLVGAGRNAVAGAKDTAAGYLGQGRQMADGLIGQGRNALAGAGETAAGIVDQLPVGGLGGVGDMATRAARAAVIEATSGPMAAANGMLDDAQGMASGAMNTASGYVDQASGAAAGLADQAGGYVDQASNAAGGAVNQATGAVSQAAGAVGGKAEALDPDRVVEIVEQRLLREIERRGGRWAGVF
ncbi:DUF4157 domain-containing protein [Actinoplanes sp. NPDC051470]|uniref:eCIS core domain-containing protein n=1 Tax=Actinoplanes sp. NPDC051470 TaxID=3157224 RepID=UPI0034329DF4